MPHVRAETHRVHVDDDKQLREHRQEQKRCHAWSLQHRVHSSRSDGSHQSSVRLQELSAAAAFGCWIRPHIFRQVARVSDVQPPHFRERPYGKECWCEVLHAQSAVILMLPSEVKHEPPCVRQRVEEVPVQHLLQRQAGQHFLICT